MKKTTLICLILLLIYSNCNSQKNSDAEILKIEEFNWTIEIPKNFEAVNEEEWRKEIDKGVAAIENTIGQTLEGQVSTIFVYKNREFNIFEANWQLFDEEIDGPYLDAFTEINNILYESFEQEIPGVKIDSSSSVQKINGLAFQQFEMLVSLPDGRKFKSTTFNHLFGNKDLSINITAIDKTANKKMLGSLFNSRFDGVRHKDASNNVPD